MAGQVRLYGFAALAIEAFVDEGLQLVLAGMTWLWTGQAAADAAREVSLGATEAQVAPVELADVMRPLLAQLTAEIASEISK